MLQEAGKMREAWSSQPWPRPPALPASRQAGAGRSGQLGLRTVRQGEMGLQRRGRWEELTVGGHRGYIEAWPRGRGSGKLLGVIPRWCYSGVKPITGVLTAAGTLGRQLLANGEPPWACPALLHIR